MAAARGEIKLELVASVGSPQAVGAVVGFMPRAHVSPPGMLNYRYAVSVNGGPFRVLRDFSQDPEFTWAPELYEQDAVVRVTLRSGKDTADSEKSFKIVSRVTGASAVVRPTSHPLVAL